MNTKQLQTKRGALIELIRQNPGITSSELAERMGTDTSKVTTSLWNYVRAGKIMTERVERDSRYVNAHYMADQAPPDAVERINQRIIDANEVIPSGRSHGTRNSVFDVPQPLAAKRSTASGSSKGVGASDDFACAITNNGSLVLMRGGEIQFSLTEREAATLQAYLVKRAAASFFANMT
ncbi:winged helix-turn-helix transcriptional regulator [Paraburkholderia sp. A1RI-2L]|uniref:winged helix-turn-helix transcriptional regulator n=1 Tax=Paraburkholderia sp. A1RI-2L TaxID=3028367 RepID=UPI003B772630